MGRGADKALPAHRVRRRHRKTRRLRPEALLLSLRAATRT